jgi:hypothetical protein
MSATTLDPGQSVTSHEAVAAPVSRTSTPFTRRRAIALALIGAVVVGGTAVVQLRNELPLRSLDANVTKLLLGLMILGCVLAFLAAINVLGAHSAA